MADPDVLTHAYLASHPADAARVLEDLAVGDATALFARVPARLGAPVLEAMRPQVAASVLPADAERGALLLRNLSVPGAAALLRYLPETRRAALIEALPAAMALACRTLLGYPEDSVGACIDTDLVALPQGARVREAIDALREVRARGSVPVYVVDGRRRPLGQVELAALLQAVPEAQLDTLAVELPGTLPAVTPIAAALEHPTWREADLVPVVERGGALVGVVDRRALRRAQGGRAGGGAPAQVSLAAFAALGYWNAVAALIDSTLSALGPAARERP
jgi:magnesium transporter